MLALIGRLGLALVPALLIGLYARRPELAFVYYFVLLPWVWLYTDPRAPRRGLGYFMIAAYVMWVLSYPQSFRFGPYTPYAFGVLFFVGLWPFAPLLRRIHHRWGWPRALSVPLVWVASEWFRATVSLGHFDLYPIGASQARFGWMVQIADLTGVYGVSFLVAAVNGLLADVLFELRDRGWSPLLAWRSRRLRVSAAAVAGMLLATAAYGVFRLGSARELEGPRLAVVQPNVLHTMRNAVGVHLSQLILTDRRLEPGEVDLIVWPENAILDQITREGAYLDDLVWLVGAKDALLLLGALGEVESRPGKTTNSAYLLDRDGEILAQYEKILLFPWGEYVPLDGLLGRIAPSLQRAHRTVTRMGWGFLATGTAGSRMTLFDMPWRGGELPFAVLICNENTYPPIPAAAGRLGARFFINITSEGEVGGPVQEQLLRLCILRAVENRIPYVRAGNTGISCFIGAEGRVHDVLRGDRGRTINDTGVLVETVKLSRGGVTVYAASRDAFAKLCVGLALLLYVASYLRRPRAVAATTTLIALIGIGGCADVPDPGRDVARAPAALERGRATFERGPQAYAAAIPQLAAACADAAICRQAIPYIAESFRGLQRYEAAAEFFARIAERHAELTGEALGYRGFFLEKSGAVREGIEHYQRSLELAPSARVSMWLGLVQHRTGDREAAIDSFRRALELAPQDVQLRFLLGRSLRAQGRLEEAEQQLQRVLSEKLDHGPAWVNLGRIREARGDDDGAAAAYRRAIEVDPRNIEARFMLARRALREDRHGEVDRLLAEIQEIEATLGRGPRED